MTSKTAEWFKTKGVAIVGAFLILLTLIFAISMRTKENPENEWQSRRGCRINLLQIKSSLKKYLEEHDNNMPNDLNELAEEGYIDKSRFICPSQYNELKKADRSSMGYSYKIVTPSVKLDSLDDGAILVEELQHNHPESVVGGISYPSGYYVIMLKKGELAIEFLEK